MLTSYWRITVSQGSCATVIFNWQLYCLLLCITLPPNCHRFDRTSSRYSPCSQDLRSTGNLTMVAQYHGSTIVNRTLHVISRVDHCLRAWKCTTMPGGAGSSPCESSRYNRNSGWRNNQSLGHNTLWENELIWFHHLRMCALLSKDNCKSMSLPRKTPLMILRAMMTISNDDNREWWQSAVMTIKSLMIRPALMTISTPGWRQLHRKQLLLEVNELLWLDWWHKDPSQAPMQWRDFYDWIGDKDPSPASPYWYWWQPNTPQMETLLWLGWRHWSQFSSTFVMTTSSQQMLVQHAPMETLTQEAPAMICFASVILSATVFKRFLLNNKYIWLW